MTINSLMNKQRPAQILLVEDNRGDVLLTKRAFKESKLSNELMVAMSGEQALEMIRKQGEYSDFETPDIVLLDLNLPQISGQDVLKAIKDDDKLRNIPVIVLSSSRADQDVVKSYNLHANGYIIKPINIDKFKDVISSLEEFWFKLVVLPDAEDI